MADKTNLVEYEDISGEAWLKKGDDFRIWQYKPQEAIECYMYAIDSKNLTEERKRYAQHMIGVCYAILDNHSDAMIWYEAARRGSSNLEEANVLRDMGNSCSKAGDYRMAGICLEESLEALSLTKYPVETGTTIGFIARNSARQGLYEESLTDFSIADHLLIQNNPQLALYNRLHWSSALSHAGYVIKSFKMSFSSYRLARQYGARAHRLRALALMVGGWRAEKLLQRFKTRIM